MTNQIPLCPTHGLSVGKDYLCVVCHLELIGKPPEAYGKYEEGLSGRPDGKQCTKCGKTKPLSEFYQGHHKNRCRSCVGRAQRARDKKAATSASKPKEKAPQPDMTWLEEYRHTLD